MAGRFRPRRRGLVALSSAAGLLAVGWLATTPWRVDHWPRVLALARARLAEADLRGAHLAGARVSGDTSWPDGFDWRGAGARMVDSC